MLTLVEKIPAMEEVMTVDAIILSAEERQKSLLRCQSRHGKSIKLNLKRGTVLIDGDILCDTSNPHPDSIYIRVKAKPEPVLDVSADHPLQLLKAAYHLGNRHVPLEVTDTYLRLSQDPVLRSMLEKMPVTIHESIAPFHPEVGAYHHHHG